jgi:uncharacterized RDD family membrane protein YckC
MQCAYCGAANQEGVGACAKCGKSLESFAEHLRWAPSQGALNSTDAVVEQGVVYSGFWRRFGAVLIDWLVLWFGLFAISLAGGFSAAVVGTGGDAGAGFPLIILAFWLVMPWMYFALMECSKLQGTLGKLAVGVKVTDLAGQRIGFGRATGRYWSRLISQMLLYIGYVMAAFTARKQALHDMMAGTVVILRSPSPEAVASAARAKPMAGWVIALIIAACLVPVAGILAAIAIPAYQTYVERARLSGGQP